MQQNEPKHMRKMNVFLEIVESVSMNCTWSIDLQPIDSLSAIDISGIHRIVVKYFRLLAPVKHTTDLQMQLVGANFTISILESGRFGGASVHAHNITHLNITLEIEQINFLPVGSV